MTSPNSGKISLAEKRQLVGDEVPMSRMGKPEDIAKVTLFMASELSVYFIWHTTNVDEDIVLR